MILSMIRVLREKNEDFQFKYTQTFILLLGAGTIIYIRFFKFMLTKM